MAGELVRRWMGGWVRLIRPPPDIARLGRWARPAAPGVESRRAGFAAVDNCSGMRRNSFDSSMDEAMCAYESGVRCSGDPRFVLDVVETALGSSQGSSLAAGRRAGLRRGLGRFEHDALPGQNHFRGDQFVGGFVPYGVVRATGSKEHDRQTVPGAGGHDETRASDASSATSTYAGRVYRNKSS